MTLEFHMNYTHLSETDILLLYTGTARIIIGISFTNNDMSYFSRIKKNLSAGIGIQGILKIF
jgi:hypothetical protein